MTSEIMCDRKASLRSDTKHVYQVGMNGDTFSIKAPKECSKKFKRPSSDTFHIARYFQR